MSSQITLLFESRLTFCACCLCLSSALQQNLHLCLQSSVKNKHSCQTGELDIKTKIERKEYAGDCEDAILPSLVLIDYFSFLELKCFSYNLTSSKNSMVRYDLGAVVCG